jgi:hypothetical protein
LRRDSGHCQRWCIYCQQDSVPSEQAENYGISPGMKGKSAEFSSFLWGKTDGFRQIFSEKPSMTQALAIGS